VLGLVVAPNATESAIANGDTRTLSLTDQNTNEAGTFTYMVNGSYDMATLEKLNWFLRDWRLNEQTKMDPKLFDILWEVYRESGSSQPIDVLSGYRSPSTNAMLRRRSRQVAEHSQHMQGKAIDAHFVDVGTATIRDITMRMQAGGVGFYPVGNTPWVHIDSGSVRYWPRMSREALTRLFPDGKTVFIPADGQPMPGYELARAEIEARGGDVVTASSSGGGLFAWLFGGPHGGGSDDAEESGDTSLVVANASPSSHGHSGGATAASVAFAEAKPGAAPVAAVAQPAAKPTDIADVDAETAAAPGSPVTLRGPIAAEFIAPLPPRKPQEVLALAYADAPLPPTRPAEFSQALAMAKPPEPKPAAFAVASFSSRPADPPPPRPPEFVVEPTAPTASQGNRDMILALLKRGQLPDVITHGLKGAPSQALALAETGAPEPPERPALIAKAAALAAPLPPSRPANLAVARGAEETRAARVTPPVPAPRPKIVGANPFGALTLQAFGDDPQGAASAERLRAKAMASN
jgi:uncharacterized protein YcbK (DUF882 family)